MPRSYRFHDGGDGDGDGGSGCDDDGHQIIWTVRDGDLLAAASMIAQILWHHHYYSGSRNHSPHTDPLHCRHIRS